MEIYNLSEKEVREKINHKEGPLTAEEIKKRQMEYGKNEIEETKKKNPFLIFLLQYTDFLVIILIIAAIVSACLKEIESSIVIFVVITINAILGTVQEIKAEKSLDALKKLSSPSAKVLRDGKIIQIDSKDVTLGDEVILDAGDYIPADGRILKSSSLKVDESALTGESVPVEKNNYVIDGKVALGDQKNMVFAGNYVTYGRANYLVTAIGMQTEIGKIATLLKQAKNKKTPLQENLDKFGVRLSIGILVFCAIIFVVQIINKAEIIDAFMFAIALAVAAIPEALSSIVTIVLAIGTRKMSNEGAVMRKLQAVEGLGSVSIICSDKTGTLTQNKMVVEHFYLNNKDTDVKKDKIDDNSLRLMKDAILCNDASNENNQEIGDPTEVALLNLGRFKNLLASEVRHDEPRLKDLPFDSDRKLMTTLNLVDNEYRLITKGAVDVILNRCKFIDINGEIKEINSEFKKNIENMNLSYSESGLRVLAFAYKYLDSDRALTFEDENDLIFLGLIAMMDPPREESAEAVKRCKEAGITPIMITGDHIITASAIAKRIGILNDGDKAVLGSEIDKYSDEELKDFVKDISVYARVSPEHKIRIVKAWHERGNIVAMTGDGVNDAPALKQADIGVAMGITGTEVSKSAAAMVLTDDNFATIVKAINNGRNVYANIKKAIQFLISGNFAAIIVVMVCSLSFLPVPFAPVHLLFINLLTDSLPAISLGLEPHSDEVMKQKPRPIHESIMNKEFLINVGIEGFIIACVVFAAFMTGLYWDGTQNALLASTFAFAVLCLSRLLHSYSTKHKDSCLKKDIFNNSMMQISFLIGFILITLIMVVPFLDNIFSVQTLNIFQLLAVYGFALSSFLLVQLEKVIRTLIRKRKNK